eukprot:scaffold24732_cov162-Cylindrotheca_fusiformis.AAC.1
MSLDDWNLSSSDEDEEGFEDWVGTTQKVAASSVLLPTSNTEQDTSDDSDDNDEDKTEGHMTVAFFSQESAKAQGGNGDEEEEEEIDWEDGHDGDDKDATEDGKLAADKVPHIQLKPVTLDWDKSKEEAKKNKKRKRVARRSYRFEHLPWDLQRFLTNLQKTHMLCLTGHAIRASEYCSEEEPVHLAHSLIPSAWMTDHVHQKRQAPTEDDLGHFCHFFFSLVREPPRNGWPSGRSKQKKQKGKFVNSATIRYRTEEFCSHLAAIAGGRQQQSLRKKKVAVYSCHDKLHLLLCMARSLGWRARYVVAIEPTNKDLDVNHPLFVTMSTRNVFQRIWKEQNKNGAKVAKKRAKLTAKDNPISIDSNEDDDGKPAAKPSPQPAAKPSTMMTATTTTSSAPCSSEKVPVCWLEILCQNNQGSEHKYRWVTVDPRLELVNAPSAVEKLLYSLEHQISFSNVKKKIPISYALAAEHIPGSTKCRLTDVTPRYATSWVDTLKSRGVLRGKQTKVKDSERIDHWWTSVLKTVNSVGKAKVRKELRSKGKSVGDAIVLDDDNFVESGDQKLKAVDEHEKQELHASTRDEPIPTSKTAFKSHPIYVIPSVLNANEVLVPDARKRFCGIFKGEMVYRRTDVEQALAEKKWLYLGRKVKRSEVKRPIKRVKARKKSTKAGFKALKTYGVGASNDGGDEFKKKQLEAGEADLEDGMEDIYASWQTDPWSPPPVGPNDPIPVNEFNNVELELLNPGLVHINLQRISKLAKQLGMYVLVCITSEKWSYTSD